MERLNTITEKIIGCAIEVHRVLGPGLLEGIYESALCIELEGTGLVYERQKELSVSYKGRVVGLQRLDLLVEGHVVVELKSVDRLDPLFSAQVLSYMKLGQYKLGLLINFNNSLLRNGIKRIIL